MSMELDQLSPWVWGVACVSLVVVILCTGGVSWFSKSVPPGDNLSRRIAICLRHSLYAVWVVVASLGLLLPFGIGHVDLWVVALVGTTFFAAVIIGVSVIPIARSLLARDQRGMKIAGYFLLSLSALWFLSATLCLILVIDIWISWPFFVS